MTDPNMNDDQERAEFQAELREQLGLPTPKPKGGARPGAGRKPKWQAPSTKVMRVPEQYAGVVRALIRHLDETNEIRRGYAPATSERLPMRSITGRAQYVTFTIAAREAPCEVQADLNL